MSTSSVCLVVAAIECSCTVVDRLTGSLHTLDLLQDKTQTLVAWQLLWQGLQVACNEGGTLQLQACMSQGVKKCMSLGQWR